MVPCSSFQLSGRRENNIFSCLLFRQIHKLFIFINNSFVFIRWETAIIAPLLADVIYEPDPAPGNETMRIYNFILVRRAEL
jgi:hypothetical protein